MTYQEIQALHDGALMPTYGRFPVALESGRGAVAVDVDGKEYIDFGSGIGVNALGYSDPGLGGGGDGAGFAARSTSPICTTAPSRRPLPTSCAGATGMGRVFLCNSGRGGQRMRHQAGPEIQLRQIRTGAVPDHLGLRNSFHGRTLTTLSATGQDSFHQVFLPLHRGLCLCRGRTIWTSCRKRLDGTRLRGDAGMHPGRGRRRARWSRPMSRQVARPSAGSGICCCWSTRCRPASGRTGSFLAYEHAGIAARCGHHGQGAGRRAAHRRAACAGEALAGVLGAGHPRLHLRRQPGGLRRRPVRAQPARPTALSWTRWQERAPICASG